LAGRSLLFALTSTTSRELFGAFQRRVSGNLKCIDSRAACSASDRPIAAPSTRSCKPKVKCILTLVRQAFHILGFLTSILCDILHPCGRPQRLFIAAGEGTLDQVGAGNLEPHSRPRF